MRIIQHDALALYMDGFQHPRSESLDLAKDADFVEGYERFFVVFVLGVLNRLQSTTEKRRKRYTTDLFRSGIRST